MINEKNRFDIIYWTLISLILIGVFVVRGSSFPQIFFFTSSLLPIAIATSYFFNRILIRKFLFERKHFLFFVYTIYTIIISLYLEILAIYISLIVFQQFNFEGKNMLSIDIMSLAFLIYLSVSIRAFISIFKNFTQQSREMQELQKVKEQESQKEIIIRADRSNNKIRLDELVYLESLGDRLKYVTIEKEFNNRDKISKLQDQLPQNFVRIHRSFIVNKDYIESFTSDKVHIHGLSLPISRTYKQNAKELLA